MAESVPGYEASSWIGLLAPAGTAQPTIDRLWNAVNTAMQQPAIVDNLTKSGSEIVVSRPDAFRQVIETDHAKYGKLADLFKSTK